MLVLIVPQWEQVITKTVTTSRDNSIEMLVVTTLVIIIMEWLILHI